MGSFFFLCEWYCIVSALGLFLMLFTEDIFLLIWGLIISFKEAFLTGVLHTIMLITILPFTIPHTIKKLFKDDKD